MGGLISCGDLTIQKDQINTVYLTPFSEHVSFRAFLQMSSSLIFIVFEGGADHL
jgi:hypothetical protein